MQVSDNFQRADNLSLGPNCSTPPEIPLTTASSVVVAGGIQVLNNAFAPLSSVGGGAISIWVGAGAGTFGNDQYAQAKVSAVAPSISVVAITAASFSSPNTTYTYTLSSG